MDFKHRIVIFIRILISRLDSNQKFHIILFIIWVSLILGSSILTDILLEQLLQADGITRLSPPKEVI